MLGDNIWDHFKSFLENGVVAVLGLETCSLPHRCWKQRMDFCIPLMRSTGGGLAGFGPSEGHSLASSPSSFAISFKKFIASPIQAAGKLDPALTLVHGAIWDVLWLPQRTTSQAETCTGLPVLVLASSPSRTPRGKSSPRSTPAPREPAPCPGHGGELGRGGLGARLRLQPPRCRFGAVSSSKIALYESSARTRARGTQFMKLNYLFVFINN